MRKFSVKNAATCLFAIAALVVFVQRPPAQSQLAVELGHPVYRIIETAELRGVLSRLSSVKPYTRGQVAEFLATIQAHMDAFSPAERAQIAGLAKEFSSGFGGAPVWKSGDGKAVVGVRVEATTKAGLGGLVDLLDGSGSTELKDLWHLNSRVTPYLAGALTPWLSIKGEAGFTIDKIEKDLYLPYEFTKEWDSNHIDFSKERTSTGEKDYPSFSYDIRQDIAAATESGSLLVRFSRFRRDWGVGSGSLALSGTARPFVGLETQLRPSKYFAVSGLVGSLTNWEKGENEKRSDNYLNDLKEDGVTPEIHPLANKISYQKMLGLQRMELFPFDWLTVSATSTVVGAKRFELGYMAPLLFSVMYQNQLADIDNLAVQVDTSVQVPRIGKFYASFYADEMEITHLSELFTKARNMFALQGGAKIPLPGLPFTTLTAQYTKIEPFVYSHYPTWYPDYRLRVDTSYTNDGENLGYYLPPNSDEFLLKFEAMPAPDWRVALQYAFVRHGDNPSSKVGDAVIFGDVTKWLEYTPSLLYMDKNFLHDGLYDFNHIVKLNAYWRPAAAPKLFGAAMPLELGAGYGFSYTFWDANDSGETAPEPSWKHVLELSVKLFL